MKLLRTRSNKTLHLIDRGRCPNDIIKSMELGAKSFYEIGTRDKDF